LKYTGKIIALAFPDTFVKLSDERLVSWIVKSGLAGKGDYIKAGHAALVLIENETGNAEYYDFGRYVTPRGKGRVRSALTDVELAIPFKAVLSRTKELQNLHEFLVWLEGNPQKTHGMGRLVASVCDYIDYQKSKAFIQELQEQGSLPYKALPALGKVSSNCSRLVTDTILAGTDQAKIRRCLKRNRIFSPSTVGNVEKSALRGQIHEVLKGHVKPYQGTAFRENITNYFDRDIPSAQNTVLKNHSSTSISAHAQYLSGIGCGAYFLLKEAIANGTRLFQIERFTEHGEQDFIGIFEVDDLAFDSKAPYQFVYDSNCSYCHVEQTSQRFRFDLVERLEGELQSNTINGKDGV